VLVGNKGVGFKAVYQVTDAPEIFSAPQGSSTSRSVCRDFGVGIALGQHPFQQTALVAAVEDYIRGFFAENAGLASLVSARGFEDPVDAVRKEFGSCGSNRSRSVSSRSRLASLGVEHAFGSLPSS
jgi:hypothetical protein